MGFSYYSPATAQLLDDLAQLVTKSGVTYTAYSKVTEVTPTGAQTLTAWTKIPVWLSPNSVLKVTADIYTVGVNNFTMKAYLCRVFPCAIGALISTITATEIWVLYTTGAYSQQAYQTITFDVPLSLATLNVAEFSPGMFFLISFGSTTGSGKVKNQFIQFDIDTRTPSKNQVWSGG